MSRISIDAASTEFSDIIFDRIIVTLKSGDEREMSTSRPSASAVFALSTVLGVRSAAVLSELSPVVLLKLRKNSNIYTVIREVSSMDNVLYAEPDRWVEKANQAEIRPNDTLYGQLYGMEKIGMPKAWAKYGTGSPDIVVCVIDTG